MLPGNIHSRALGAEPLDRPVTVSNVVATFRAITKDMFNARATPDTQNPLKPGRAHHNRLRNLGTHTNASTTGILPVVSEEENQALHEAILTLSGTTRNCYGSGCRRGRFGHRCASLT